MSRDLDKFYTKASVVQECYQQLGDLSRFDLLVEPSAGNGAFLPSNTNIAVKAYDIAPEGAGIQKADFLTLSVAEIVGDSQSVVTIGNPPFGRNGAKALAFTKKAMEYSQVVAFILPRSFKKDSVQNKVPCTFDLISSTDLQPQSFLLDGASYDVPCVFQIWQRTETPRVKHAVRTTTPLFQFVKPDQAQLTVRRVGVYAGTAYIETEKSEQSHYFIALPESSVLSPSEFVELCNTITWEHNNTTGPRSISKGELIEQLEKIWPEKKVDS